ncbi:MAG: GAF domain-containing protein [Chloroflexi bacterium]|nr:GAF domain-containing protein [Chloroflexota bacterium]
MLKLLPKRAESAPEHPLIKEAKAVAKNSNDLIALCENITTLIQGALPVDKAIVSIVDTATGTFTDVYHFGVEVPGRKQGDASRLAGTFAESIVTGRKGVLIQPSAEDDMSSLPPSLMPSVSVGLVSFLAVPIIRKKDVVGILHLRSAGQQAYTEQSVLLVEQVALAIAFKIAGWKSIAAFARLPETAETPVPAQPAATPTSTTSGTSPSPTAQPASEPATAPETQELNREELTTESSSPAGPEKAEQSRETQSTKEEQSTSKPQSEQPSGDDQQKASPSETETDEVEIQKELDQLGGIVAAANDIARIYDEVAIHIRRLVPFDRIVVSSASLDRGMLTTVYTAGPELPSSALGNEAKFEDTLFQHIVRQRRGLILGTGRDDEFISQHRIQQQAIGADLPSLVAAPLVHQDRVVGTMELRSRNSKAYGQVELVLLHKIATAIAGAVADSKSGVARPKPSVIKRVVLSEQFDDDKTPLVAHAQSSEYEKTSAEKKPKSAADRDDENALKVSRRGQLFASDDDVDEDTLSIFKESTFDLDSSNLDEDEAEIPDDEEIDLESSQSVASAPIQDNSALEELRREAQEGRVQAEIARTAAVAQDLEEVFSSLPNQLASILSVDSLHVLLADQAGEELTVAHRFGNAVPGWERTRTVRVAGSYFEPCIQNRTHALASASTTTELAEEHRGLAASATAGITSFLAVPLISRSKLLGVIAIGAETPEAYKEHQAEIMANIASVLAASLSHVQEMTAMRREAGSEAVLTELAVSLASTLKADDYYQRLAEGASKLVKFDRLVISEVDSEAGELVHAFITGGSVSGVEVDDRIPIEGSLESRAITIRAPFLVSPLENNKNAQGFHACIFVPIVAEDEVVAVVSVLTKTESGYVQHQADLLGRMAVFASSAIANIAGHAALVEAEKRVAEAAVARSQDPMLEIGRIVWTAGDLQSLYTETAEHLQDLIPFERFAIWTIDAETGALLNTYSAGVEGNRLQPTEPLALLGSGAQIALANGKQSGNGDKDSARRLTQLVGSIAAGLPGLIIIPLFYENEGVGMLSFGSSKENAFTSEHEELAEKVAQLLAARVGLEQISIRRALSAHHMQERLDRLGSEAGQRTRELDSMKSELETLRTTVYHDLRKPLSTIDSASQTVLDTLVKSKSKEGREQALRLRAASRTATQQIENLAQMAEVTNRAVSLEEIDLSGLARNAGRKLRSVDVGKAVTVSVAKELFVEADRYMTEVLLDRLFEDASERATRVASPRIQVGASTRDGELVFYVRDNGKAIAAEVTDAMFDEEKQYSVSTELARRVVERHGGRIWAESESRKGTTIYFTLN